MDSIDTVNRGHSLHRFRTNEPAVIADVIDGETIIMNLDAGHYYSLNATGGQIWESLAAGRTGAEVATSMALRYGREFTRPQLDAFIDRLLGYQLLVLSEAPAAISIANSPPSEEGALGTWNAPEIVVYSDMKDLLAMDPPLPGAVRNPV